MKIEQKIQSGLVMLGVCTHLGCVPLDQIKVITMDGFVHVMVLIMIHLEELEKDQLQQIWKFLNTNL